MLNSLRCLLSFRTGLMTRSFSDYVSKMRHLNRLKGNDDACTSALKTGRIFLFHKLDPLVHRTKEGCLRTVGHTFSELEVMFASLGAERDLIMDSILIGCSDQTQAQFCLDVGQVDRTQLQEVCPGKCLDFRKALFLLAEAEAPLVAKAQALLRWHQNNKFCSATGQRTQRNQSGSQRVGGGGRVYYPTMSPVAIFLPSDGKRCLLARQSTFPPGMYSALAGFCDIGETLEDALRREAAEEVGLEVEAVTYSSSQHWPLPHSSFMLACHASVSPAHAEISMDQSELEDARWFTLEEVSAALQVKTPPSRGEPTAMWLPPRHAIAHRLISEWVELQRIDQARQGPVTVQHKP
ncbi:NAD(P)H pyrophosphatase NUDT13, mitochondrial [Synchiropus picturatus]